MIINGNLEANFDLYKRIFLGELEVTSGVFIVIKSILNDIINGPIMTTLVFLSR